MDDDSGPTASIIFFVVLVLIDMFFYGFSSAITSLNEKEVERKAEEEKDKKSQKLVKIIGNPARYVNTLQVVVSLINVIMGVYYVGIWKENIDSSLGFLVENNLKNLKVPVEVISGVAMVLTMVILLYILLTFGVLLPKKIAARVPEKWAYACVNPIFFLTTVAFAGVSQGIKYSVCYSAGLSADYFQSINAVFPFCRVFGIYTVIKADKQILPFALDNNHTHSALAPAKPPFDTITVKFTGGIFLFGSYGYAFINREQKPVPCFYTRNRCISDNLQSE